MARSSEVRSGVTAMAEAAISSRLTNATTYLLKSIGDNQIQQTQSNGKATAGTANPGGRGQLGRAVHNMSDGD